MAVTEARANEIKSIIASLLISTPHMINVRQLWRDYAEIEGEEIPLRDLGFASFEEYLRSIPETVHLHGYGPTAQVEGVVSSKSQHINEMVLKQKKNPKRRAPLRTPPRMYQRNNFQPTRKWTKPNSSPVTKPMNKSSPFQAPDNSPKNPQISSNSNKIRPPTSPRPILEQEVPLPKPSSRVPEPQQTPSNGANLAPRLQEDVPPISDTISRIPSGPQCNSKKDENSCGQSGKAEQPKPDSSSVSSLSSGHQTPEKVCRRHWSPPRWQTPTSPREYLPFKKKNNVRSDTTKSQTKRESRSAVHLKFPKHSSSEESDSPPVMALSLSEAAPAGEDLDFLRDVSPSSVKICTLPKPSRHSHEFEELAENSDIPVVVQKNLKRLIERFPDGLESSALPREYRNMFNRTISYLDYDFISVIHMCSDLPKIIQYVQGKDDYVLFPAGKPIPDEILQALLNKPEPKMEQCIVVTEYSEELAKVNMMTARPFLPKDICTMETDIPRLVLTDVGVKDLIDVTMGEIYDPSKCWMYLTYGPLEEMMKELQSFFSFSQKSYRVPENLLEEGLYCVAKYCGKYHRCLIVRIQRPLHFARVIYIDYGTIEMVPKDEIWFLPKKFSEIPWQAMRMRLANICPPCEKHPWSQAAIIRFNQLVVQRVLVAEIVKIDTKEHVYDIRLSDITSHKNIFYINEVLIEEGLAISTNQERKPTRLDPDCVPTVSRIHRYPTFFEIECGAAPTREEIKYIFDNNIPLHHVMPQYFDIFYKEDIASIEAEYRASRRRRSEVAASSNAEDPEVDFSYFPRYLGEELRAEDETAKMKSQLEDFIRRKPLDPNESVKEYSCNRNRILKLKAGIVSTSNEEHSRRLGVGCDSPLSNSEFNADLVPLIGSLDELNFNTNSDFSRVLPVYSNGNQGETNPFLNDGYDSDQSSDSTPRKVGLKGANVCTREQSDVHRREPSNTSSSSSFSTVASVPAAERGGVAASNVTVPLVQPPPGFNGMNQPTLAPVLPNVANYINFMNSVNPYYQNSVNPYYQRTAGNANGGVVVPPEILLPLLQAQYNNATAPFPFQYNFNATGLQPFGGAHNYYQPPH